MNWACAENGGAMPLTSGRGFLGNMANIGVGMGGRTSMRVQ